MLSSEEVQKIEKEQVAIAKRRDLSIKVLRVAFKRGFLTDENLFTSTIRQLKNDGRIEKVQFDIIVEMAERVDFPIPEDKVELVWKAVSENFTYRHFNQFGQELK